jgi:hypothetical protein
MRIIPSRNHVMAAERIPAAYRPSNQARLEPARASNPSLAEADAFMPESSELRYGNSRGDNGLSLRYDMHAPWDERSHKRWGKSAEQRLPSAQPVPLTTEMTNITGAPPQQLPSAQAQLLTTPIVPADVSGLGFMAQARRLPSGMRHVSGTPMTGMHTPVIQSLRRPTGVLLRGPVDSVIPHSTIQAVPPATMVFRVMPRAMSGLGALDTPSLWLAGGAIVGLFLLMRNRQPAR